MNAERVVTTVGTVATVTSSLEQLFVEVTFVRFAATLTRYVYNTRKFRLYVEFRIERNKNARKRKFVEMTHIQLNRN